VVDEVVVVVVVVLSVMLQAVVSVFYFEKIFTHLANYLLIRTLKLLRQKKVADTNTDTGACVNTVPHLEWTLLATKLSHGNRLPK